ncbi:OmpA family protein [Pedobacter sp. MC2016-24]|uniref:OmpA family protein n=1 Tax=Pedobacter sp. MC2016-24 TaxID=2780090 RepID=UPI00187F2175|nr:OmpA family protein [Pedobacter sp. MC2016-24]MBE9602536.1 PD40 domain-containing protein [Pedobacter sp. MC2016-24]
MKNTLVLLLLCVIINGVYAQSSTVKKAQVHFDQAQLQLKSDHYDLAIASLNEAVKQDPNFQFAYIQLADLQRRTKAFELAKSNYAKAIALGGTIDPRSYYGFAESEIYTGDYVNARKHISLFISEYKGKDADFLNRAKKYLRDCEFSIEAIKSPVKYEPQNMGPKINSNYRDYFPSITADQEQLIFSRNLDGNEDFFISKKDKGEWTIPVPLSAKINTSNYNEGAQSLSPDGKYLFFTGCNRPDGLGRCDIYVSHQDGKDWSEPFNLGAPVNSIYWDSQPAISPDGTTLYFVSNRPGGIGGYDLWKSHLKDDGYWTEPENLGPEINTAYDENTPFIHPDGKTLYFSSDGWPGLGNKDIFMSRMDQHGKWTKPQNLGYPINTFNEETGLIVTTDGKKGIFSSNLNGGYGDMDIYEFNMPETSRPQSVTYVKGIVKDKKTGAFLEAQVQVLDLKSGQNVFKDYTARENGEFLAVMPVGSDYAFNASAAGYAFYSEHYELNQAGTAAPFQIEIALEKLVLGQQVIMKNIFFNTNEYTLLPSSLSEIETLTNLLNSNKNIHIEIQGHTDNTGSNTTNQKLSIDRAKAVYDRLISNGIATERLSYKGYGQTQPVTANDTEEHRKLNRRTSFLVTSL